MKAAQAVEFILGVLGRVYIHLAHEPPRSGHPTRFVVCAALQQDDELVVGPRHFDAIMRKQIGGRDWSRAKQGFIDQRGRFMDRHEAFRVATQAYQIRNSFPGRVQLYSEDLY